MRKPKELKGVLTRWRMRMHRHPDGTGAVVCIGRVYSPRGIRIRIGERTNGRSFVAPCWEEIWVCPVVEGKCEEGGWIATHNSYYRLHGPGHVEKDIKTTEKIR